MYERRRERLLTPREFGIRVLKHGGLVAGMVAGALAIGILGYHVLVGLSWIDSLLNASMILGGMGPVDPINTNAGKIFASFYALFSGLFVIAAAGVMVAPFLHRMMHRFHLDQTKGADQ